MGIQKQLQQWKNNNPIRRYRKQSKLSQVDVAGFLGVGVVSVQRWESGSVMPSEENVQKLNGLIEGFSDQWKEWISARPKL